MDCPACRASNPETQSFCGRCGSALGAPAPSDDSATRAAPPAASSLETGGTFAGRYQVIEELGHGGMGRVYKVIDKEIRAKVALKLIRPEIASNPATVERFRQELKTAREISHPNVCRMYDLGRDGDRYFLTMEYVPGEDLKSMIAMSGQLGIGTAISIAKQVCAGLAEAHRLGVVHRDLKPQNIQIDKGGHAKIMDFGVARAAVSKGLTDGGVVVGTPLYMSPEQAEAKSVDARSDVYSLGVIFYEMLTGQVPFDADTPLGVAMRHKLEAPRDPRELNATVPPDLAALVLRCLEKDRERRYQSAGDVLEELHRIEAGLPTTAKVVPQKAAVSTSREITVHFTVRQLLLPALGVLAVLVVLVAAWQLWPHRASVARPAGGKPTLAVLYFENLSGDAALDTWKTGLPELLITGLSQSRLMNVVSSDRVYSILKKLNLSEAKRYSSEDLASVAREGRADYVLTGSVMKAGGSTIITTRLQRASSGEVIKSEKLECATEQEILSKVDAFSNGIKADLDLSPKEIAGDSSKPLDQVLTNSPEALKFYNEARRFHLAVQYRDAIPLYEKAIEIDPRFAMAYRGLAACYSNIGDTAKEASASAKAIELADRLPERLRYQVELSSYMSTEAGYPKAIEAGTKLLAKYPDDAAGLHLMGYAYGAAEQFEKSTAFRLAAMDSSPNLLYVSNLASNYRLVGEYGKARELIERFLQREPSNVTARLGLARTLLAEGQLDAAEREAEQCVLLAPRNPGGAFVKSDVASLRGDFALAERELRSRLEMSDREDQRAIRQRLAFLSAGLGRFAKAREELKASPLPIQAGGVIELVGREPAKAAKPLQAAFSDPLASDPSWNLSLTWLLGLADVAAADEAGVEKVLTDLRGRSSGFFSKPATRYALAVSGVRAVRRGDAAAGVADLERSVSLLPNQDGFSDEHALLLDCLAEAYTAAGNPAKSGDTYLKIEALTTGRLAWGAIYARSFYRLGLIAERQGDKHGARERFTKFLELWKDADPGMPEVADARKRLAK